MNKALFPDLIVNGEHVPYTVVAAETQNHDAPEGKPGIAWRKAANAVAIRTLLLQEAALRGLAAERQEVGPGRFETDEEALIRRLLENEIDAKPPCADAIRDEWEKDPKRFRTQPLWEVSHILCACDPRDKETNQAAKKRALGLLERINVDPKGFAAIAKNESDCGSRSSAGALGQLGPGETVPEFESALVNMKPGQITDEPVLTRHGWHIIRMDAVAPGKILPFDAVRQRISDAMEKASWAKQARHFVDTLVAAATISGADLRAVE